MNNQEKSIYNNGLVIFFQKKLIKEFIKHKNNI